MRNTTKLFCSIALPLAAALAGGLAAPAAAAGPKAGVAQLPSNTQRPTNEVLLSIGEGQLINLPANAASVWTSNPGAADVYVNNPHQINLFGKDFGEATVFATSASGAVIYAANVRVSQNITSIDRMIKLAMPDADIKVTTTGQIAVLTGTVASPEDNGDAEALVRALLNPGVDTSKPDAVIKIGVVNRLRTATPLQVNLQVRVVEVSRELVKEIGVNLMSRDQTGGFLFGVAQGRNFGSIGNFDTSAFPKLDASSVFGLPTGSLSLPFNPATGQFVGPGGTSYNLNNLALGAGKTAIGLAGKLFGIDVASAIDLAENDGLVTTLANPNLTALSGETASFLAGGEIPIPVSQALGALAIEYKQYGVSLAFTPTVLGDGRISMRVRPEVSQLSSTGAVTLNGFNIPGFITRRAETTVELGSGQSFMIGGLLQNSHTNSIDKAPGIGDLPVIGALFRSSRFKRSESELLIIVTPYLVRPVSANQIALPTDGYKAATDVERVVMGQSFSGDSGAQRPVPTMAPPVTQVAPGGPVASASDRSTKKPAAAPAPGFSIQ